MRVILLILKKNRTPHLLLQLSPVMATTGLLIIVWTIPQLLDSMREAKPMFKLEIWWFIGKYIFAIFTLASLSLLIVKWKKINSGLLKVYITSLSVALCFLLYTLIANSWYP
jgi:hypothetical protein